MLVTKFYTVLRNWNVYKNPGIYRTTNDFKPGHALPICSANVLMLSVNPDLNIYTKLPN